MMISKVEDRAGSIGQPESAQIKADSGPAGDAKPSASLTYVADFYNRYPGELVTLYATVTVHRPGPDLTLRMTLPEGLQLEQYGSSARRNGSLPYTEVTTPGHTLVWSLAKPVVGVTYEYQFTARVGPARAEGVLESQAILSGPEQALARSQVLIAVSTRGSYLQYLPAFYEQDQVVGRLLMMCESFWAPLEAQIATIDYYLDPGLTPSSFLPWLAGWLDIELYQDWPEDRLRELLRWAVKLYQKRGTRWALQKYLEIYTGQRAEIVEHRFKDVVLDEAEARLDYGIALGPGNRPHTFTINLWLSPLEIEDEADRSRQEKQRRRTIEMIIELQKPAQTVYTLNLQTFQPSNLP